MNPEQENRPGGSINSGSTAKHGSRGQATGQTGRSGPGGVAAETVSRVGEAARQAGAQAQDAASSVASRANKQAKKLADRQLGMGAETIDHLAEAVRAAANRLDRDEPQIAQVARSAADRIEDFSETIRGQSAEDLWHASADFARRHPAALFGATAGLGFVLFRLLRPSVIRGFGDGSAQRDFDWEEAGEHRPASYHPVGGGQPSMRDRHPGGGETYGA